MQAHISTDEQSKKILVSLKDLGPTTTRAIRRAFYFIGKDLVKESRRLIMLKPKHGRLYRLPLRGRIVNHRASAPGEAPANFTKALKSSIDFNVVGADRLEFGAREKFLNKGGVEITLKTRKGVIYAKRLEEGDDVIAKRPFLIRSIKSNYRNIETHFEEQIKAGIGEGAT